VVGTSEFYEQIQVNERSIGIVLRSIVILFPA